MWSLSSGVKPTLSAVQGGDFVPIRANSQDQQPAWSLVARAAEATNCGPIGKSHSLGVSQQNGSPLPQIYGHCGFHVTTILGSAL